MKLTLTALTVAASLMASGAYAFDPDDLQKLKDTNTCRPECDLTEANLRGADLSGANLTGTYMNGAILCNTIMPDGSVLYSGC